MGYGPASYINAEQVKLLNQALAPITTETLKQNFDGKKMLEQSIYPTVWDDPESLDFLLECFEESKEFYKTAAQENMAVISFLY